MTDLFERGVELDDLGAEGSPKIAEADAATDGLLGPISGFIYSNAPYTGTYVYPEFLDANGVIIWAGGDDGSGVAVGGTKPLSVVDRRPNFPTGGTIQFGFTQGNDNGQVNDQQHKFQYQPSSTQLASFTYTGNGYLIMSMEYNGLQTAATSP